MMITLSITLLLVALCVVLHYEALRVMRRLGGWLHRNFARHRLHFSMLVFGLLLAHVLEVLLFGVAYFWLVGGMGYGAIVGSQGSDFAEYTYFSLANYTSLGYGDLVPSGPLRFMAGMEALTGLVLIGWTAAFMYLEMRHIWERENSEPEVGDLR